MLHFSESTIRRDLIELEKKNLLRRTPGGAIYVKNSQIENSTKVKFRIKTDAKRTIAKSAMEFITDYQTIFLDSSSTSFTLAKLLVEKDNLKIFTTNIETALILNENPAIQTYIIGGLVQEDFVRGNYPVELLKSLHADISFLSCKAFNSDYGCYEIIESEAIIKKTMQENSDQSILLVDDSKFNLRATYKSLSIDKFDYIITNNNDENDLSLITDNYLTDVIV